MSIYKDFTPEDIAKLRAGCEEWNYFPLEVGLDALAKIEALKLQLSEVRKDAWEHCVRIIEAPIPGLQALAKMTGDKRGLIAEHMKALSEAGTSVRESQQFIAAVEKQKAERLIDPQQNCDHEWSHIEDHHVYCPKCKKTADLCWTCEAEKQNVGGMLVCLKCRGN